MQITLDRFFKKRSESDGSEAKNAKVNDDGRNIKTPEIVPPDV